jgi:hypothetical protein
MRVFIRRLLYFLIPFYFIIISYFCFDPFKILYDYDNFYLNTFCQLNRENISLRIYNKFAKTNNYNSFVFGSSRTLAFKTNDWGHCTNSTNFHPFVFDASNESIEGITSKIEYLHRNGSTIKYALIIICSDVTFSKDVSHKKEHWYIKHPLLSNNSKVEYYFTFFKTYLQNGFFIKYIDYKIFKKEREYMLNYLDFRQTHNDSFTNDLFIDDQELNIKNDSLDYYERHKNNFYKRPEQESLCHEQIDINNIQQLKKIKDIFNQQQTYYKIIISPLYDQKKLNPIDLQKLKDIFGKENVFDYSGKNEITENKYNYFESSHYRYRVGQKIMQDIYSMIK